MKVFDSELTYRGTERKRIYSFGDENREAKEQALKDIKEEERKRERPEIVKPYREKKYVSGSGVWQKIERKKIKEGIKIKTQNNEN